MSSSSDITAANAAPTLISSAATRLAVPSCISFFHLLPGLEGQPAAVASCFHHSYREAYWNPKTNLKPFLLEVGRMHEKKSFEKKS